MGSARVVGVLPQFYKLLRPKQFGKFFSTTSEAVVKEEITEKGDIATSPNFKSFRYKYQEFLPDPEIKWRNLIREKLERRDMLRRRNVLNIPEFYVGSILAVTTSDIHAPGKTCRFVGICILRKNCGLRAQFLLRNVIQSQGVEVLYYLYSPVIQKIEVLKLEKRLDDDLLYLRDAPHSYSTFSFDMEPEFRAEGEEVYVNPIKVPLNPRPWLQRYERMDLKGAIIPKVTPKMEEQAKKQRKPWEEYDLMDKYRRTLPAEEQQEIFESICNELAELEKKQVVHKKKKDFKKQTRHTLF